MIIVIIKNKQRKPKCGISWQKTKRPLKNLQKQANKCCVRFVLMNMKPFFNFKRKLFEKAFNEKLPPSLLASFVSYCFKYLCLFDTVLRGVCLTILAENQICHIKQNGTR